MKKVTFVLILVTLLSSFNVFAQKQNNKNLLVKVKEDTKPLVIVDGKKFDFSIDLIDQSKIESINILKSEEAKALYNTSNGVILIKTKVSTDKPLTVTNKTSKNLEKPTIIIDGKIENKETLDKLEAEQIEKMEVIKGEMAVKKYNSPGGVIIITTKKK